MRNHPKAILRMAAVPPGDCAVSTVTAYELYAGVEKCSKPAQERAKVDLLLKTVHEIAFESAAAKESARIRAILESQGLALGPYDLLLAGLALACCMTMVTANTKEFSRVPRLTVEDWQS
jgi:tRNA(fMet)-specific endonuclease VapC